MLLIDLNDKDLDAESSGLVARPVVVEVSGDLTMVSSLVCVDRCM